MKITNYKVKSIFLISAILMCLNAAFSQNKKPNIIFILTDDQGYGDIGAHGNPYIKTPYLDQLNKESVCFTDFHVETTCAPSRAGLMSGNYSNKVGAWHTIKGREILSKDFTTIADVLKSNGYKTAIYGKWHIGDSYPFRPEDRGFDEVLIHKGGGVGQTPDYWNNDYFDDTYFHNNKPEKFKGYCTDVWFDNAKKFIESNKDKPFFCYLALNAPHSPYTVDPKYTKPYLNNTNITHPEFYGMISNIDENLGQLREKLVELGIDKNTILVFMTDNGSAGAAKFSADGNKLISGYNAGMRGLKASPFEGGHRVPFFIHYPDGGLSTHKDINDLTAYIDFMPTVLAMAGIDNNIQMDGENLMPLIKKESINWGNRSVIVDTQREENLIKNKDACVMNGKWRLLKIKGKTTLYDISTDPFQSNDVSAKYPKILAQLNADYDKWWKDISVNKDKYSRFIIGAKQEKSVTITSHDSHSDNDIPAWNQELIRKGIIENGFYTINFEKNHKYFVELRRYPKESGLKINSIAPPSEKSPDGTNYLAGKAMNYTTAQLNIGGIKLEKPVTKDSEGVKFKVKLKKGDYRLTATFKDNNGVINNAYYIYLTKN